MSPRDSRGESRSGTERGLLVAAGRTRKATRSHTRLNPTLEEAGAEASFEPGARSALGLGPMGREEGWRPNGVDQISWTVRKIRDVIFYKENCRI